MRKLLLSLCAAVACWMSDVGATSLGHNITTEETTDVRYMGLGRNITMEEIKMETEGRGRVCEALSLGTSNADFKLLKNCAEFPNLEQVEIEDEDAWIFRRPEIGDIDSHFFKRPFIVDKTTNRIINIIHEDEQVFKRRVKSFPKLKRIIGKMSHRDSEYSIYDPFSGYGEPYADCSMKRILQDIMTLKTLEEISLNGWNLACVRLPREIENLKNLRVLSIANSGLYQLPESIGNLRNLQHLELRNEHNLTSLPESIGNLKNLESLNLSGTYIKSFPESIKNLGKLKTLDLRNSSTLKSRPFYLIVSGIDPILKRLPDFIWKMPALENVMVDKELEKDIPFEKLREIVLKLTLAGKNHEKWSDNQLRNVVKLRINGFPFSLRI